MKKLLISFYLALSAMVLFSNDLRKVVVVVEPKYSEKILNFMDDSQEYFNNAGYRDIGKIFKNAKNGVSGSGFFVKGADNKIYVLTNYHVAAYSESLTLTIVDIEGNKKKIENCKIIAADEELDLAAALVSEPSKVPFTLSFTKKAVKDGDDVWSAGYPDLGGEAMWQLGKGIVSNSKARIPAMVNPKKSFFIQHSAPIDSGNSGGPLLIKSGTGYEAAGMNSAKAIFRQATNFAIPSQIIEEFMNNGIKKKSANISEVLKEFSSIFEKFDTEKKKNEKIRRISHLALFISDDYAMAKGQKAFKNVLSKAPAEVLKEAAASAVFSNPINGLKTALAYEIYKQLNTEENEYKPVGAISQNNLKKNGAGYNFTLTYSGNNANFFWKEDFKSWKINSFALNEDAEENSAETKKAEIKKDKEKKAGSVSVSISGIEQKSRFAFSYEGFKAPRGFSSGLGIEIAPRNFKYFEPAVSLTFQQTPIKDMMIKSLGFTAKPSNFQFKYGIQTSLQIPINFFDTVTVIPQVTGGLGFLGLFSGIYGRFGINFQFILEDFQSIGIEAGYLMDADYIVTIKTAEKPPVVHGFRVGISYRL